MEKEGTTLYAAIILKGTVKTTRKILDTLEKLRLRIPNSCVIVPSDSVHKGMLKRVAEYITWGEISEQTLVKLLVKRGGLEAKKAKSVAAKALKEGNFDGTEVVPVFRLSPPSGGLKSIRIPKPKGDLGYRGEAINALLERMI